MVKAVIYARFSTELQSDRSTEDQIALCRSYAAQQGFEVLGTYEDKAKSGASIFGRDGLQQLLADATQQKFDVIIVESLDRLARDMEDLAGIHKRMSFLGIRIMAVHDGEANTVLVGLRSLVGQMFREDTAHKVRRGLAGRVKTGQSAGGQAYGYRPDPFTKGELQIFEEEAEIVRRIFQEYVRGKSPRKICHELNAEQIRPPRGDTWAPSTLNGNVQRGYGVLRNQLYNGKIVWNRVRMVKDPDTGKRVSRANPPEQWVWADREDSRIVDQELFDHAQNMQAENSFTHPVKAKRPTYMLSGLLRCGECGYAISSYGKSRRGGRRVRCSGYADRRVCDNSQTYLASDIDMLVLDLLRKNISDPRALTVYVEEYYKEQKRLEGARLKNRGTLELRVANLTKQMTRYLDAIGETTGSLTHILEKIKELQIELDAANAELTEAPVPDPIMSLHPAALLRYEKNLIELRDAIEDDYIDGSGSGVQIMREIIECIKISPLDDGFTLEIKGNLQRLMGNGAPDTVYRGSHHLKDMNKFGSGRGT